MLHEALATGDTSKLNHEQLETYERCQAIVAEAAQKVFGADTPKALKSVYPERELSLEVDGHKHVGHPDRIYKLDNRALIPDFKSLRGNVDDADNNEQLRDYSSLLWKATGNLTEIATVIIQPLVTMRPVVALYTQADLWRAFERMVARIRASHDPTSPRRPGELQCQYCAAKTLCQEYHEWASSKLPVPSQLTGVPVANWTPEQRKVFCENKSAARKWLDDTEQAMKDLLAQDPAAIPGWELSEGNEVESLTNIQPIYERFIAIGGKHEGFMECLKGVKIKGKLNEQVSAATGAKGKALTSAVEALIEGCSEKKRSAPSLQRKKE